MFRLLPFTDRDFSERRLEARFVAMSALYGVHWANVDLGWAAPCGGTSFPGWGRRPDVDGVAPRTTT